jgi:hypothetical protein
MAGSSNITTDHDAIRKWAEERGGKPSQVAGTGVKEDAGLLRIDFPGRRGKGSLEEISWEEFFEKFDEKNLALLYQEKTAAGKTSRFSKIVSRETADKNRKAISGRQRKKEQEDQGMDDYSSLFLKDMQELKYIAEEKEIPHPEEFNKEELVMVLEMADLAEKEG